MKTIFVTRFSFMGRSGWKSKTSEDPNLLFAPERLEKRLAMFEKITLQCLADQTDDDFEHLIISSEEMPKPYQKRLTQLSKDVLGDRAKVSFLKRGRMGPALHGVTMEHYADQPWIAQVVLDDDDALSKDFVEICKYEAARVIDTPYESAPFYFLSFLQGLTLNVRDENAPWIGPRHEMFTNLGLTIVKPPSHFKNIFNINHLQVGWRFSSRVVGANRPFFIRTVHDTNDSKGRHKDDRLEGSKMLEAYHYFPLLNSFFDTDDIEPYI